MSYDDDDDDDDDNDKSTNKVPKYTLVQKKHPSKRDLEITTKILTMNNTYKAQSYVVVKRESTNVYNQMVSCLKSILQSTLTITDY